MSLQFDDTYSSQALIAVPNLVKRGLVGTFFANPGTDRFKSYSRVWGEFCPAHQQELANHTMNHIGAQDYEQADYEIGECARYIWSVRPPGSTKLQAFARGGGTTWNITSSQMNELLNKYHCITRHSLLSCSTDNGVDAARMTSMADRAISNQEWIPIHFHSITEDGAATLSIKEADFIEFLDYLSGVKDQLWVGGYISVYQYREERNTANLQLLENSPERIVLNLTSSKDSSLFKEPLTLLTEVPTNWDVCQVTQNAETTFYVVQESSICMFSAVPNRGNIILSKARTPKIVVHPHDTTVFKNEKVIFTIQAIGSGNIDYQWQQNGVNLAGAETPLSIDHTTVSYTHLTLPTN